VITNIIYIPDLGGAEAVEVIELCVAPGDTVELEQTLIVLESDKATMDVPSPKAGIVKALIVKEGDTVSEGSAIIELESELEAELESELEAKLEPVVEASPDPDVSLDAAEPEKDTVSGAEATQESAASVAESARSEQIVGVPDIGTSDPVEVIEVLVSAGDTLAEGDSLVVVEGDKATMDIPAPFDGEVIEVLVKEGGKVTIGDNLARVMGAGLPTDVPESAQKNSASVVAIAVTSVGSVPDYVALPDLGASSQEAEVPHVERSGEADVYAGPASRALARELGVDLHKVAGTGPRGRILKEDLQSYVKNAVVTAESGRGVAAASGLNSGIPAVPDVDFKKFGEVEMIPLKKIHKLTAANMQRSWLNVPHVTQFDEADITDLEDFRASLKPEAEKRGARLTPLPFMLKACAHALLANPEFNRSITSDGENFVQKKYIHIGVAVDTPRGLVVPVIRDVDTKGLWQLAIEVSEMASKARDGKLSPAEMQGGCFTISSLGAIGGNGFTPIVNTPEVGILGVSKSQIKPVWSGSEFLPRMMLPLSVSYDHRVVNGADCGRFFTYLVKELGDTRRLAL
jgi:pyruvate dehydrogenase E2 component (dihydrolipoyllysine-residue acetyltransferase)